MAIQWLGSIAPYLRRGPMAAFLLGISSGFPYAMIGATLTTWLAQEDIDKKSVTAFVLALLVYNFKPIWSWVIDGVPLPLLSRLGQRVSWLIFAAMLVMIAVGNLAFQDPRDSLMSMAVAAVLVGLAGATFDIVIDAYRIEILQPHELGVGSGMNQYGWRIGAASAGALALFMAARYGWVLAYLACALYAVPAVAAGLWVGEPTRRRIERTRLTIAGMSRVIIDPFAEFFQRSGAVLVLLFILIHKIGDTLANLTFRLLFETLGYSNDEIAIYDVGFGFWAYLAGIFVGGMLYSHIGMKRSVLLSLFLMMVSNLSFAMLAAYGKSNWGMAGAIGFENFASGIGGVVVVAYFSALCDLRFTAAHYALISSAASILGRFITGTTAGGLIETLGYVNFYLLTTIAAVPGVVLFWWMVKAGMIDLSIGSAGRDARVS